MAIATMTSKGQFTLPKKVREELHLKPGDQVEITVSHGKAVMRAITKSVDDVFGMLKQPKQKVMSVEEMNLAIAEKFKNSSK